MLHEAGYSLQGNRKSREGASHPDRNAQFEHINRMVARFLRYRQPAISVDTKRKELVGDFANAGREWHERGNPEEVRTHDFMENPFEKGFSKPLPKRFGLPLLRNGLRYFAMFYVGIVVMTIGELLSCVPSA